MLRKSGLACLFCALYFLNSATNANTAPKLEIPKHTGAITVDGELDDALWSKAKVIDLNLVNSPYNNTKAPVKTTARILENSEYIYISFLAEDPNPSEIKSSLKERDTAWSDDLVGIRIDTLNQRRITYNFFVNPQGVQMDEIYDEVNQEPNELWDGIWHSAGKITDNGYQVEIAIPYRILNFDQKQGIQQWPFELIRSYPRETQLRLSHIPLDRNNNCWVCQYPLAEGFEGAKVGKNLTITPALVLSKEQKRNIFIPNSDYNTDEESELSLDVRWGINTNTLLNATINPDFSTIEADAGQLSVNETFSLFYTEKRPFFTENVEFFASPINLVYTRNIADPDYGVKLTGTEGKHSYGIFTAEDNLTSVIISGNISSRLGTIDDKSQSSALRYRYNINDNATIGAISTLRDADDYHNYVYGIDGSYRLNESNLVTMQWLYSDTLYPDDLFKQFCTDNCQPMPDVSCEFGNCSYTETALRSNQGDSFSDSAFNIKYSFETENWLAEAFHQSYGKDFRADLGFINRIDYQKDQLDITRRFYSDDESSFWSEFSLNLDTNIEHNENGEFIGKATSVGFSIDGPKNSLLTLDRITGERVGIRENNASLAIDNNTKRFQYDQWKLYAKIYPTSDIFLSLDLTAGDNIDYANNRVGDYYEAVANFSWFLNRNILVDLYQTVAELETDNERVYLAKITDLRFSYHFDNYSFIKLSVVYNDVEQNPDNTPFNFYSEQEKTLSTKLVYTYKLNPQTAFYLGYSDFSYQDDSLSSLTREQKTFFAKFSYAWMQ